MHDDLREVNGHYEMFQNGHQVSVGGDLIPQTVDEMSALRDQLYEETSFGERYVFNAHNFEILGKVSTKLNRHASLPTAITQSRLFEAYAVADSAGGLTEFGNLERVPEEIVTPAAPVARDGQGRFINPLLAEYYAMLADPSLPAHAISQRMRIDRPFREAIESEGKVKQAPLTDDQRDVTGELRSFVDSWRRCPNPKPIGGFVRLDERTRLSVLELDNWINRASAAGLL